MRATVFWLPKGGRTQIGVMNLAMGVRYFLIQRQSYLVMYLAWMCCR